MSPLPDAPFRKKCRADHGVLSFFDIEVGYYAVRKFLREIDLSPTPRASKATVLTTDGITHSDR